MPKAMLRHAASGTLRFWPVSGRGGALGTAGDLHAGPNAHEEILPVPWRQSESEIAGRHTNSHPMLNGQLWNTADDSREPAG
jgi:hypothetical protein